MTSSVEWASRAEKQLAKLDRPVARALVGSVAARVEGCSDPRSVGTQLVRSGLWRYRVGDYRVLCYTEDARLVVPVVELGHRREIYRR